MNLQSISRIAYGVVPKCEYDVIHVADLTNPATLDTLVDDRGFYNVAPPDIIKLVGVLSGITEQTLSWVPEGLASDGFMTFSTDVRLELQGGCGTDLRAGYILTDKDGQQWRFMRRRMRGCVFTYLLQLYCPPDCP